MFRVLAVRRCSRVKGVCSQRGHCSEYACRPNKRSETAGRCPEPPARSRGYAYGPLADRTPVAVTRHGQTVGYFIPARGQNEAELAALRQASQTLDALLAQHGVAVDDVVAEYKQVRSQGRVG